MSFLASDVMDGARVFLNDVGISLYTNAAITPHVSAANEELESELLTYGVEVQRKVSSAPITIGIGVLVLSLPTDFLLPVNLFERASGSADPWIKMTEKTWNPVDYISGNTLTYWAFYNNAVNFPASTAAREVTMEYERQLAVVTGPNSPEDFILSKRFLCAKTAELCARYVGMNTAFADSIAARETEPSRNRLVTILVRNMQGNPVRRQRFSIGRYK